MDDKGNMLVADWGNSRIQVSSICTNLMAFYALPDMLLSRSDTVVLCCASLSMDDDSAGSI